MTKQQWRCEENIRIEEYKRVDKSIEPTRKETLAVGRNGRKSERGQAILLLVLAMSIFLLGAMGLAIDGSQLYAHRQMAQAAADAAAQAGAMSIFDGTNGAGTHAFVPSSTVATCARNDQRTPCYFAQTLNGFNSTSDIVTFDAPTATTVGVDSSKLSASDSVNLLRVTVQRSVSTTLIRFLGPTAATIKASAVTGIVNSLSPVPIIVTHPTLSHSFSLSGTGNAPKIQIYGGPSRSVQVNSSSTTSLGANGNPIVDLTHAGPNGTGADFGDFGGPSSPNFVLNSGTGNFVPHASPILDPLSGVSPPSAPTTLGTRNTTTSVSAAQGCLTSAHQTCHFYSPGLWTSDIQVKNEVGVFKPGIYYMQGASFTTAANGYITMASGFTDGASGTSTGWTGNVLIYMTGTGNPANTGTINVGANGSVNLVGSPSSSAYQGILFFVDRNAAAATHTLDGGGGLTLVGTIYATNTLAGMLSTPARYQTLSLQGNAGSSTNITGEIIVSALSLSGTPGVVMTLSNLPTYTVRQLALVK